ncbi:MAG: ADP-ribosylglycohydrolase family protein [Armatimonadota bacterium]
MRPVQISLEEYRDKVYACWLGKNIGGTLGAPYEGQKNVHSLTFYDPLPDKSAPNDDLDLQLVWLEMLRERGIYPTLSDFADYWKKHLAPYPWNEYGFCQRNLARGLHPPISGCFENYYIDEMGSPIRSEIWACVAPGDPQLAASLAWMDAALDHAGGEGTYGEMFWAAVESAAFVVSDPHTLIRIGLSMIPVWSRISRVVREAVWCYDNGLTWQEARERILANFGHNQPCHAPQNHGFTVVGWLYGKDYGDKLCTAVNCGYDTDCTGATLGSVLGIIHGTKGIPQKWIEPIGDTIVLHPYTRGLNAPKTVAELTERTTEVALKMVKERSDTVELSERTVLPGNLLSLLFRNERALMVLTRDPQSAIVTMQGYDVVLHYGGEPVLRPGIEKVIAFSVKKDDVPVPATLNVRVPSGWRAQPLGEKLGQHRFALCADEVADRNTVSATVMLDGQILNAEFTMLGPGEAKGYPAGVNVPTCSKCHARVEACICAK